MTLPRWTGSWRTVLPSSSQPGASSNRKEYIDAHKPGRTIAEVTHEVLKIRFFGGIAILTSRTNFVQRGTRQIETRVFVKEGGLWKCTAVQATTETVNEPEK